MTLSQRGVTTTTAKLDTEKAIAWLNKHWKGNNLCPVCANDRWGVTDELVEMRPFRGGSLVASRAAYPLLGVTCNTCGLTLLFNAVVAGLIKGQV